MSPAEQPYIPQLAQVRGLAPSLRTRFVSAWLKLAAGTGRPSLAAIAVESGLSRRDTSRLARDRETLEAVRRARNVETRRADPAATTA